MGRSQQVTDHLHESPRVSRIAAQASLLAPPCISNSISISILTHALHARLRSDGFADLLLSHDGTCPGLCNDPPSPVLLLNRGTSPTTFTASTTAGMSEQYGRFALGDSDGDGTIDVAIVTPSVGTGGTISLHLNSGAGVFTNYAASGLGSSNALASVAFADIDVRKGRVED